MLQENYEDFNWDLLKATCPSNKKYNKEISKEFPDARVYSHYPGAMEMYKMYMTTEIYSKDFNTGDVVLIEKIDVINDGVVHAEIANGYTLELDINKEKRFCKLWGIEDPKNFTTWLSISANAEKFIGNKIYVKLTRDKSTVKGSLIQGHEEKTKNDFIKQITKPTVAYNATVVNLNRGGFIVDVLGIPAFLPGGLAAANKISNFEDYLGKEIPVMVEDYLPETKTFIMSNKKYVRHVLPQRIEELDIFEKQFGTITGTTKYGIFIEFGEIFTGLLHTSKMSPDTFSKFKNRLFEVGEDIDFWVKEITKDNRIIITEEDPSIKLLEYKKLKDTCLGNVYSGRVLTVKPFGALIKIGEVDKVGLIPRKKLKGIRLEVGEIVYVILDDVKKEKIYLSITDES
jgi:predicted RNA-binding protein with RPS1 domain